MESIREIYRIGAGPSSSHTMGPKLAAEQFRARVHGAASYQVVLYESLAATGKGHLTDKAIREALAPLPVEILWAQDQQQPEHPNAMDFTALDESGQVLGSWTVFSIGGGALRDRGATFATPDVYPLQNLTEIMDLCAEEGITYWEFVALHEGEDIWIFLEAIWTAMQGCMERGLNTEGVLPGGLGLARKASSYHQKTLLGGPEMRRTGMLAAYALAVSEENASGGTVVTAPTCGASGVLPSALRYLQETMGLRQRSILQALATAGLIGLIIKKNASISGAEVGCQGEVGSACAMAAAAAAQLMGGTIRQIEYAAEMGLEHHLGLTCDPVGGWFRYPASSATPWPPPRP